MTLSELSINQWEDTRATLHMWMQIVGKVRLELAPQVNHWWEVPFYLTSRGLTTSPIPYQGITFDVDFDFIDHTLLIRTSEGANRSFALRSQSVAEFYREFFETLHEIKIDVKIWPVPVEIPSPIPFEQDTQHASYNADYAHRFWRILTFSDQVFKEFRGRFIGKHSPVHFFWGSFDLASTRFSGRTAPEREWSPSLAKIMREAYSHEVSSVGWWPGDERLALPSFYSYAAPEPAGFRTAPVLPAAAYYNEPLGGFYLHYDELRASADPEKTLLDFCHSTYDAAAKSGDWDKELVHARNL